MKIEIDVDERALARAARVLGTTTEQDTIAAALAKYAPTLTSAAELWGLDIDDPEVMRGARR